MTIHVQTPEPFSTSRAFTPRRLLLAALLVVLTALVLLGQNFRIFDRAWFAIQEWRHADAWKERSIRPPDYHVRVETQPVEGLNDGVSALTFGPDRYTLFTVANQPAQIIRLSLQDKVLRTTPLAGFGDTEAIEYISRGVYMITDERQQRLVKIRLKGDTRFIDTADVQQLSLGIGLNGNKGFEGLAYDAGGKRLFAARERDPVRIYEIHGLPHTQTDKPFAVHVVDDPGHNKHLFAHDLSSLQFNEGTGYLLALSDELCLVVGLDTDDESVSILSLLRGIHGLKHNVPQAEGAAMDDRGVLYLVSEPSLLCVFNGDEPAQP